MDTSFVNSFGSVSSRNIFNFDVKISYEKRSGADEKKEMEIPEELEGLEEESSFGSRVIVFILQLS